LAAFLLAVPGAVLAQAEPDGGGDAFAGGQMVRGTVTGVGTDRLTVKTEEGDVYQVSISLNTRVMKDRQPVKIADIKAGDGVGAMGVMDAPTKTLHAVLVAVMDAEQVKKAREGLGKVYITGKVTAIDMDEARVTVMRPDHVSQVIQADEGTSFRRGGRREQGATNAAPSAGANAGGESITLADVKVGDLVMGRGAVKNGLFVPAELRVMDASAQGRRRGAFAASAGSTNGNGSEGTK
jgi:predicted RNA-binding protein